MTFRLPLQIFRAVLKDSECITKLFQSTEIRSVISARNYSSIPQVNNKESSHSSTLKRYISSSPSLQIYKYRLKINKSANPENRKKVRKIYKCRCPKKCKRKLAFRQTSREECSKCLDAIRAPVNDPGLCPLKPAYDDSKLQWKHVCPEDICDKVERMDDVKGYKVVDKELPKIKSNDCKPCLAFRPTKAPKLTRPNQKYDPSTMKWKHPPCADFCDDCVRMDDVCGYKVTSKELPKPPLSDCELCLNDKPIYAPKLRRPTLKYDPSEMKWKHPVCLEECEDAAPRMDDVCGLKIEKKKLPKIPMIDDCKPCINVPKCAPKLKRPTKLYDESQLKWVHPPCADFCDDCVRMDDVLGYKVKPKCLPQIKSDCERCIPHVPTQAPELKRPPKKYDDSKMHWDHTCPPEDCDDHPARIDDVLGLKIEKKKLPQVPRSDDCEPCADIPTICPKLTRPEKLYDDRKMKWTHICNPDECELHPPKSDVVTGYKITKKKLKKYTPSTSCKPCLIFKPTKAPMIMRPKMLYDPNQLKQERICIEDTCNIDPPRMDNVLGFKVEDKILPKLTAQKCPPCLNLLPKHAPDLARPKRKYDPNEMLWNHPPCEEFCDDCERIDDVVGYKVTPKCLPTLPTIKDCKPCIQTPKYAPKLKRPKLKYDPSKLEKPRKKKINLCDLDPPRMDDVLCWKPKKKILPSINCDQCKHYSTLALPRISYPKRFCKYKILWYNTRMYGKKSGKMNLPGSNRRKRHSKKKKQEKKKPDKCDKCDNVPVCTKCPENTCNKATKDPCKKPSCECKPKKPKKPNPCPTFKMKHCKKRARQLCEEYKEHSCKKVEAPYEAFGDNHEGFYEDPPSECINYNEVLLQPQKQVSGKIFKLKPPPPKFGHIDPEKERKCLAEKLPDPEPLEDNSDKWQNPCPQMEVCPCKPRARKLCESYTEKCCTKLNAPYKSFSDRCPQFPELEIDECSLVEKLAEHYMVTYTKKVKSDKECSDSKGKRGKKVDRTVRCGTKMKDVNEDHTCEKVFIPTWATRRASCKKKKPPQRIPKSDKCKKPGSKSCKNEKCCEKMKCEPKKKQSTCSKISSSLKSTCEDKPPKKPPKKSDCKKKQVPNPKCGGGCNKPGKGCGKGKKSKFSGASSVNKILKGKNKPCIREPMTKSLVLKFSTLAPCTSKTIWEKICECFQPRPDAPTIQECIQRQLEMKARKAAAAAGLQIMEPSYSYIKIDWSKCNKKLMPSKRISTYVYKHSPRPPSERITKEEIFPKNQEEINQIPLLELPKKQLPTSNYVKKLPEELELPADDVISSILKTQNFKSSTTLPTDSIVNGENELKRTKYSLLKTTRSRQSKYRYFSTYSRFAKKCRVYNPSNLVMKKGTNNSPLKPTTAAEESVTFFSQLSPYLRLSNTYVGRIYKLKLRKIGVQNKFLQNNSKGEPFTICHSCKVVPRHELILNPLLRHVQTPKNTKSVFDENDKTK